MIGTGRPIRVLELRSVFGTGGGPEKTILLSAAQHDPARVASTVCYIRDRRDRTFHIDERAQELGVDYVEVVEHHSFDARIWWKLKKIVASRGIDIVHAHEYKTDLLAWLLARSTGIVPLSTVHGWSGQTRRESLYYYADKKLLTRYPLVIAVSEPIRQTLIEFGANPSNVRRISNGVDHTVFTRVAGLRESARRSLGIPPEAVVLGSIGRLEPEKRYSLLLDAAAALRDEFDPFVVIAGAGSQQPTLEAVARDRGMLHRLKLLGHRHDVVDIHHAFDVYVQTSDREGIPNAVLEAMAVGTPVVATDVGGTGELISDAVHGLLVPAESPAALTAAVRATLVDSEAAARRARAARARVQTELSFAARLAAVEQIYRELLDRHPKRTDPHLLR